MDLYTHVLGEHQGNEMEKLEKQLDVTFVADEELFGVAI